MMKTHIPKSKLVVAHVPGLMKDETLKNWLEKELKSRVTLLSMTPWNKKPEAPALITCDTHRSHLVTSTLDRIKKESKLAIIPAELTSKLQPLDLTVKVRLNPNCERNVKTGLSMIMRLLS